ncbi:MAG: hypothetical protein CMJ38_05315 [Phycisphaerae bacterium]|nr:hypothetical protein [Phycisphaerae bacterium]
MVTDMSDNQKTVAFISPKGRGGIWLAVTCAAIGAGVLLSGLFSGSTGFYGDAGHVGVTETAYELTRECGRVLALSLLLLLALRIEAWRKRVEYGGLMLTATRCLAIVLCVEALRVIQLQSGIGRLIVMSIMQYVLLTIGILSFFTFSIKEAVKFSAICVCFLVALYFSMHLGIWLF